jgi:hypothetical protein
MMELNLDPKALPIRYMVGIRVQHARSVCNQVANSTLTAGEWFTALSDRPFSWTKIKNATTRPRVRDYSKYAHALTLSQGAFENKKPICSIIEFPFTFLASPSGSFKSGAFFNAN